MEDVLSFRNERVYCVRCQDEEFQDVDGCYNDMGHAAVPFLLSYLVFGFVLISLNLFGSIFYLI